MWKQCLKLSALAVCFSAIQMVVATASSLTGDVDTLKAQISDMAYGQARALIISNGWQPLENPAPDDLFFFSRDLYDQGFVEVDICAPTGNAPCTFYFTNEHGQYLKVQTLFEEPVVASVHMLKDKAAFDQEPHSGR